MSDIEKEIERLDGLLMYVQAKDSWNHEDYEMYDNLTKKIKELQKRKEEEENGRNN